MSDQSKLDTLLEMVPFYVNGTIGAVDKQVFEAALKNTPELREELDRETALQARFTKEMDGALGDGNAPADTKVQSLFGSANSTQSAGSSGGLASALSFLNPKNWNPAVTFALAAAAVSQTAIIGSQASTISDLEEENYQLASGQGECDDEATIVLEPSADASWAELNALLSLEGLVITGGGYAGPLMLKHNEDEDLNAILERLKASDLVASAEPVT